MSYSIARISVILAGVFPVLDGRLRIVDRCRLCPQRRAPRHAALIRTSGIGAGFALGGERRATPRRSGHRAIG
jgi:hypothetical protein